MNRVLQGCIIALVIVLAGCTTASSTQLDLADTTQQVKNGITSVVVVNESDKSRSGVPVTFALPFVPGDVPADASLVAKLADGSMIPIQVDRKATNNDGSLRHGVITVVLPHLKAHQNEIVVLALGTRHGSDAKPASVGDLPSDFDASVGLSVGGTDYTASVRDFLKTRKIKTWLSGPLVSEWIVSGPVENRKGDANSHLAARFAVRYYQRSGAVRVSTVVENDWTYVPDPHTIVYDATLTVGGKPVYHNGHVVQHALTRWRKTFWWNAPPQPYVKFNLAYLKATHTIPNYDPDLEVPESTLAEMAGKLEKSNTEPGGVAFVYKAMPATGGRGDIGPMPRWTVLYLLSMDRRAWKAVKTIADLSGSWPIHYRDKQTGLPLSLVNHPKATDHSSLRGWGPHPIPVPDSRGHHSDLKPNFAHEPGFAFVPYLLTGDYYYLEELQFWTAWNDLATSPAYREYSKGLIYWQQVRGQAWSLRNLVQTAYITPDAHPMKRYWVEQLENNLEYYNKHYPYNQDANQLHVIEHHEPYNHGRGLAPWMDDFFTWAIGYVAQLGYEKAEPMWRWKAKFPVGRMLAPGYCYVYASLYYINVKDNPHDSSYYKTLGKAYEESVSSTVEKMTCGGDEMARHMGRHYKPGDMVGYPWSPIGYPANMQPALASAVDAGVPGAVKAWKLFMSRPTKPNYDSYPNWDIVPRAPLQNKGTKQGRQG